MSESTPVVHIIDDDASYLVSLTRVLKLAGYMVQSYASAKDFLLNAETGSGCVVTDLRMPDMDGLELQQIIARSNNPLPIVFLSGEGDIPSTVSAMRQGAEDFITKNAPKEDLFAAVNRAIAHDMNQRAQTDSLQALRTRIATLTSRELEVLSHVLEGKLNKQIAEQLGISERTIKYHRTAITTKLQMRSVAELARLAQSIGLFEQNQTHFPNGQ
jgi:two-component system response regulator FixJ